MAALNFRDRFHKQPSQATSRTASPLPPSTVSRRENMRQRIAVQVENLPALPAVVMQILSMIRDPNTNAPDFEKQLRQDQVLTARLLKIVNSSFYGRAEKINTISKAVVTLGMKTLRSVVLATGTTKILDKPLPAYGFDKLGLWKHALATATYAQVIAQVMKRDEETVEKLFVMGLLHDIGKVVLGSFVDQERKKFQDDMRIHGIIEAERNATGHDHATLGEQISHNWKLPDDVAAVMRHHHHPDDAGDHAADCAVVHLANFIAVREKIGLIPGFPDYIRLETATLSTMNIDKQILDAILNKVNETQSELRMIFHAMG